MSGLMAFVKIVGGVCIAVVIFTLFNLAASGLYTDRGLDEPAYVVIEDEDAPTDAAPVEEPTFEELLASADPSAGESVFRECRACHKVAEGEHAVGPSLHAVVGRQVASAEGFDYSEAFLALEGEWTPERIDAFIANPQSYARGTAMTYAGLRDAEDRADVIAYLQSLGM
ncbi:cytochrome c [Rhodovulum sp. ES.010]|uniref:c-type cytochrome n=1 Tax=Rhodovulum sp. ES.010 TaxID=1882821 RepID=UPI00092B4423|nr:c-type cytochrome [Rhodovulum sp. ES.010]SIO43512.1 cytochrome c [Rhodovulum sp. ES.010]